MMLLDIKAAFISLQVHNTKDLHAQLLASSDFRVSFSATPRFLSSCFAIQARLQDRLTACLLSPNLTAYVADLSSHVMVRMSHAVVPN
jgi:hypothetical protein